MVGFIGRRTVAAVFVLFTISVLVFLIFFATPGVDPAARIAGRNADPATLAQVRHAFGLDRPLPIRYGLMMEHLFVHRDLTSFVNRGALVIPQILQAVPVTLSLVFGAAVVWMVAGLVLGTAAAAKRGTVLDPLMMLVGVVGVSIPVYWLGEVVNLFTQSRWHDGVFAWVPPLGYVGLRKDPLQWALHLVFPWLTLAALYAGIYARVLRGEILEALNEDYVRTARAKGLSERRILVRHALRCSLIPVVSLFGLDFGALVGGSALLTEVVFGLPGVGKLTFDSLQNLDLPVIMGCVMYAAFFVVLANAVVDMLYAALDPGCGVPEPLLEVRDLSVSFRTRAGRVTAVDRLSFTLHRGEVLGIVGESGSGKSVSMMSLLQLIRDPNATIEGEAVFRGADLLAMREKDIRSLRGREIAMIFQDPMTSMTPVYTVGWQIAEQVRTHSSVSKRAAHERAVELLEEVGIPDPGRRVDDFPHEFSGGMRQRAMIAMALANNPALLIADEPTTALDVTTQAQILALMRRLQADHGSSIILITHDMGVVSHLADQVLVMYAGRAAEQGPKREVFHHPRHPYTWGLLDSVPRPREPRVRRLPIIPGSPPSPLDVATGCPFAPRCRLRHDRCDERPPLEGGTEHVDACWLPRDRRRELRLQVIEKAVAEGDPGDPDRHQVPTSFPPTTQEAAG